MRRRAAVAAATVLSLTVLSLTVLSLTLLAGCGRKPVQPSSPPKPTTGTAHRVVPALR